MIQKKWLTLLFSERLTLAVADAEPASAFQWNGKAYHCVTAGAVSMFYDRLTDESGNLRGIQFWPTDESRPVLFTGLPDRSYIEKDSKRKWVRVYLKERTGAEEINQGDQAFGDKVFRSEEGDLALVIDLGYLLESEEEFKALQQDTLAVWGTISSPNPA